MGRRRKRILSSECAAGYFVLEFANCNGGARIEIDHQTGFLFWRKKCSVVGWLNAARWLGWPAPGVSGGRAWSVCLRLASLGVGVPRSCSRPFPLVRVSVSLGRGILMSGLEEPKHKELKVAMCAEKKSKLVCARTNRRTPAQGRATPHRHNHGTRPGGTSHNPKTHSERKGTPNAHEARYATQRDGERRDATATRQRRHEPRTPRHHGPIETETCTSGNGREHERRTPTANDARAPVNHPSQRIPQRFDLFDNIKIPFGSQFIFALPGSWLHTKHPPATPNSTFDVSPTSDGLRRNPFSVTFQNPLPVNEWILTSVNARRDPASAAVGFLAIQVLNFPGRVTLFVTRLCSSYLGDRRLHLPTPSPTPMPKSPTASNQPHATSPLPNHFHAEVWQAAHLSLVL